MVPMFVYCACDLRVFRRLFPRASQEDLPNEQTTTDPTATSNASTVQSQIPTDYNIDIGDSSFPAPPAYDTLSIHLNPPNYDMPLMSSNNDNCLDSDAPPKYSIVECAENERNGTVDERLELANSDGDLR